ncbi:hypothetical protein C8J57DRAFT_1584605 [Mycena rebaudengoi]|nr:hypothetical protein C8J57DRAFT_1584605 [Mycena rebaudengoi]
MRAGCAIRTLTTARFVILLPTAELAWISQHTLLGARSRTRPGSHASSSSPVGRSHPGCARLAPSFTHRRAATPCGCTCVLCRFRPTDIAARRSRLAHRRAPRAFLLTCSCAGMPRGARVFLCCVPVSRMRDVGITDAGLAIREPTARPPSSSRTGQQHPSPVQRLLTSTDASVAPQGCVAVPRASSLCCAPVSQARARSYAMWARCALSPRAQLFLLRADLARAVALRVFRARRRRVRLFLELGDPYVQAWVRTYRGCGLGGYVVRMYVRAVGGVGLRLRLNIAIRARSCAARAPVSPLWACRCDGRAVARSHRPRTREPGRVARAAGGQQRAGRGRRAVAAVAAAGLSRGGCVRRSTRSRVRWGSGGRVPDSELPSGERRDASARILILRAVLSACLRAVLSCVRWRNRVCIQSVCDVVGLRACGAGVVRGWAEAQWKRGSGGRAVVRVRWTCGERVRLVDVEVGGARPGCEVGASLIRSDDDATAGVRWTSCPRFVRGCCSFASGLSGTNTTFSESGPCARVAAYLEDIECVVRRHLLLSGCGEYGVASCPWFVREGAGVLLLRPARRDWLPSAHARCGWTTEPRRGDGKGGGLPVPVGGFEGDLRLRWLRGAGTCVGARRLTTMSSLLIPALRTRRSLTLAADGRRFPTRQSEMAERP